MRWNFVTIDRFDSHAGHWDALVARAGAVPFMESLYVRPLLQAFGDRREILAYCTEGEAWLAAAILTSARAGLWKTVQPPQLPLGAWLSCPDGDLATLLRSLVRQLPGFALALGITQLDPRLQGRPLAGAGLRTLDYIKTAWVDLDGTFDAYWDARGKNLKQNMRKQRNKLGADGISPTLECITSADQVGSAIVEYGRLESSSWKAGEGTAVDAGNAQGRFYREMLEGFCAAGRGRIYRYRFGEKVVAMDLCIEQGDLMVILKTAYDQSYKTISPAYLMRQEQFQLLFDEARIRRVEFYGKLMEWHTRWTEQVRTLYHLNAYRWDWLHAVHEGVRRVRDAGSRDAGNKNEAGAPAATQAG